VSCSGCHAHNPARLKKAHKRSMPKDGRSCVRCHPGGLRR
jgi:hypothetical protein